MYTIYKITNTKNLMSYIGKTRRTPNERFREHIKDSRKEKFKNRCFLAALREYGADNFIITTIEYVSDDNASERERYWISYFDTFATGYNSTFGGDGRNTQCLSNAKQLYEDGLTLREIANRYSCDVGTLRKNLRLQGVLIESGTRRVAERCVDSVCLVRDNLKFIFRSVRDVAQWLIDNSYTKDNDIGQVSYYIRRVLRGKDERKSVFGFSVYAA